MLSRALRRDDLFLKIANYQNNDKIMFTYSENGWISCELMLMILDQIYSISQGKECALILDQYSVHMLDQIKDEAKKMN